MKQTIRKALTRAAVFSVAVLLAAGAWALPQQSSSQGQQNPPKPPTPPNQPTQPGQPAPPDTTTPAANPEEEAAYKSFFEMKGVETQQVIKAGEDFLKKFPESRYRESIYSRLANAYLSVGQVEKMYAAGEKALELNPQNVDILALMAYMLPRRVDMNALDAEQKLGRAESYGKQAITLIDGMQKPAPLSDEDFTKAKNDKLSMCHSGLGVVYYQRQKFADSVVEFEQSTKLAPQVEPSDLFLMGLALDQMKRYGEAVATFGKCGDITWAWQDRCKAKGAEAKKLLALQQQQPPKQ